ncbi:MAG: hypothetical protein IJX53_07030 [Clostridia bacterium]|nr:hypothetical protein [Clostridia bacterium]
MKFWKRTLLLALCGLLLAGATACGGDGGAAETTDAVTTAAPETEAPLPDIVLSADFKLVRPEDADQSIVDAAMNLRAAIQKGTGLALAPASDWFNPREENITFPATEILIGATNRAETAAAAATLRWDDYVITAETGKLVILGGSDAATLAAITYFSNKFAAMTTFEPAELYRFNAKYAVEDVRIGDVSLAEYTLVYPYAEKDKYSAVAESINARLREISGISLPTITDRDDSAARELWLGPVKRDGASAEALSDPLAWSLTVKDSAIQLTGGSSYTVSRLFNSLLDAAITKAADAVVTLELATSNGTAELPAVALEAEADVRIMSSNILFDSTLADRVPLIANYYLEHLPDLIGMQEVNTTGEKVFSLVQEFYGATNTEHADGKHCYTPILYRKDKYNLVASGSCLYDSRATDTKSMSWAVVENKQTGKKMALCNTHSSLILASYNLTATNSVEGEQWRVDNVRQLLERVDLIRAEYGNIPVFITGDFNSNATKASIQTMKKSLPDSADLATVSKTKGINSFHNDPGQSTASGLPIDFVFVTDDVVEVRTHYIDNTKKGVAISDHCPVYIDVKLK